MSETTKLMERNRDVFLEIDSLKEQINQLKAGIPAKKVGNPAVVGLAGFGLTTMVLQYHNIGWMDSVAPVVVCGLMFGGLAQLIAGLQEYGTGNNFGYSAFTTYGAFWMSLALLLIVKETKLYVVDHETIGFFLLAFTLYTVIMTVAAAATTMALFIVFFLLSIGFILLDIGHFGGPHGANKAAGWVLLFDSLGAWYCMLHVLYMDVYGFNVLPVGPPPATFVRRLKQRFS